MTTLLINSIKQIIFLSVWVEWVLFPDAEGTFFEVDKNDPFYFDIDENDIYPLLPYL